MKHTKLLILGLLVFFTYGEKYSFSGNCILFELQKAHYRHFGFDYKIQRNLDDYESKYLGKTFREATEKLKHEQHWIDMGAGEARAITDFALGRYYKKNIDPNSTDRIPPFLTAISLKKPKNTYPLDGIPRRIIDEKFQYVESSIESLNLSNIRKADLITDVWGPIMYSPQIDQVIAQYLRLLQDNGKLIFFYYHETFIQYNNKYISLYKWLSLLPGIKVEKNKLAITVLITDRSKIKMPKLNLTFFKDGVPTLRNYETTEDFLDVN